MEDRRESGPAGNPDRLRAEIDSGATRDKVAGSDPAASPLGTDAEAGGSSPTAREVETARAQEVGRGGPQPGLDPNREGGGRLRRDALDRGRGDGRRRAAGGLYALGGPELGRSDPRCRSEQQRGEGAMDPEVEKRIRARAYQFWVDEGWPAGRELEHWRRAVDAIAAEDAQGRGFGEGEQARFEEPPQFDAGSEPNENVTDMMGTLSGIDPAGAGTGIDPKSSAKRRRS